MAGSLIKLDEKIASNDASITLGGSNWDSSYDVYMVRLNNVQPDTDIVTLETRFTVSGTPDTSANYDEVFKTLRANTTFNNAFDTNGTGINLGATGTATGEQMNAILYLFNFNNASEYSFITVEGSTLNNANILFGREGGGVLTVAQACNGIQFFFSSGNIDNGTFTLYGLKK